MSLLKGAYLGGVSVSATTDAAITGAIERLFALGEGHESQRKVLVVVANGLITAIDRVQFDDEVFSLPVHSLEYIGLVPGTKTHVAFVAPARSGLLYCHVLKMKKEARRLPTLVNDARAQAEMGGMPPVPSLGFLSRELTSPSGTPMVSPTGTPTTLSPAASGDWTASGSLLRMRHDSHDSQTDSAAASPPLSSSFADISALGQPGGATGMGRRWRSVHSLSQQDLSGIGLVHNLHHPGSRRSSLSRRSSQPGSPAHGLSRSSSIASLICVGDDAEDLRNEPTATYAFDATLLGSAPIEKAASLDFHNATAEAFKKTAPTFHKRSEASPRGSGRSPSLGALPPSLHGISVEELRRKARPPRWRRHSSGSTSREALLGLTENAVSLVLTSEVVRVTTRPAGEEIFTAFIRHVAYINVPAHNVFAMIIKNPALDTHACYFFHMPLGMATEACATVNKLFRFHAQQNPRSRRAKTFMAIGPLDADDPDGTSASTTDAAARDTAASPPVAVLDDALLHSTVELDRGNLKPIRILGAGEYGTVWEAELKEFDEFYQRVDTTVAVKLSKSSDRKVQKAFLEELIITAKLHHPNIVRLFGVAVEAKPLLGALEYCIFGDIRAALQACETKRIRVTDGQRLAFARQICSALDFVNMHRCSHNDVAARNCLLTYGNVLKLSDFGLARFFDEDKDSYRLKESLTLPVRWLPPEVLTTKQLCQSTDVWSFGVYMWELFTNGVYPYNHLKTAEVPGQLEAGTRLEQPTCCPDEVYALMSRCWAADATARPSFRELSAALDTLCDSPQFAIAEENQRDLGLALRPDLAVSDQASGTRRLSSPEPTRSASGSPVTASPLAPLPRASGLRSAVSMPHSLNFTGGSSMRKSCGDLNATDSAKAMFEALGEVELEA